MKNSKKKNIDPTGYPSHDETFCSSDRVKYSYFAMIDSNNQMIINDSLFLEENYRDFLPGFIEFSQKDLTIYANPLFFQSTTSFIITRF